MNEWMNVEKGKGKRKENCEQQASENIIFYTFMCEENSKYAKH